MKKGDIFYVVSSKKRDKKWLYGHVAGGETLGLVPARVLQKDGDENHINEDGMSLLSLSTWCMQSSLCYCDLVAFRRCLRVIILHSFIS